MSRIRDDLASGRLRPRGRGLPGPAVKPGAVHFVDDFGADNNLQLFH